MLESTFLSGKVIKVSLPVLAAPSGPEAPARKRLLLPQGELAQVYDSDEPIRYLAYIELREHTVRGNHYHRIKEEMVYLIQGELLLVVEDVHSKGREQVPLQTGDVAVIQPGVAHVLRILKAGHALEYSKTRFEAADTYRYPLGG